MPETASRRSRSDSGAVSSSAPWWASIIATDVPMIRASSYTVTPAASACEANVERRSYRRAGFAIPDDSTAGFHSRRRKLWTSKGPPFRTREDVGRVQAGDEGIDRLGPRRLPRRRLKRDCARAARVGPAWLVPPTRVELPLLDPQLRHDVGVVAPNPPR